MNLSGKQQFVTGYILTFAMPIGFPKVIKLYYTEHNVESLSTVPQDAAIWAEQQLVAIPGWLREDQNARLHQEEHFAPIKQPRSPTTTTGE